VKNPFEPDLSEANMPKNELSLNPATADDVLLEWPAVKPLIGNLSRTTVWTLRRAGKFPQPVQISNTRVAWRRSEILAWMAARPAAAA
jgi:predicted DNA-binding transcriptional regulator AlpA